MDYAGTMSVRRALELINPPRDAKGGTVTVEDVVEAWRSIYNRGAFDALLPWQKGVMQNLIEGGIVEGAVRRVPGLPASWKPYGAIAVHTERS